MTPFADPVVAQIFSGYAASVRPKLLKLRELIFLTAKHIPGVGALEETLKWGQPSYLTTETKSGSTIRLDGICAKAGTYALYFHCQTTLVETFKEKFGPTFRYEGNRGLIFSASDKFPEADVSECIALALTYHVKKGQDRIPIGRLIR